ncbi:MAG TPA: T9SS type A sorting domain-containing protein, partial [Ignavibacteriaceae bacterium]|nr:T9SS type A sorting domain-containing protein [Ignavibacteriaceae bacterium]
SLFLLFIFMFFLIVHDNLIAQAQFETGAIGINVSNGGRMRVFSPNLAGAREVERTSVLVGVNQNAVFDYPNDADVEIPAALVTSPIFSDFEITSTLNNEFPAVPVPPDVLVRTNVYGWLNESYVVVRYRVINKETSSINAIIGFETLHRTDNTYENDTIAYDPLSEILYAAETKWVGYKILSTPTGSAKVLVWYSGYSVDSTYYSWLTYGNYDTTPLITDADGDVTVLSTSPVSIAPEDSAEIFFAIAIGGNKAAMESNMSEAEDKYNTIVPVELTSFSAKVDKRNVTLNWQTATEINNRGFEIERKLITGNESQWVTIGFREGFGTTTQAQNYFFGDDISDVSVSKISYRLKQIDFNGTFSYSDEIEVDVMPLEISLKQNYPNPFNPATIISFAIPSKEFVSLKVFNLLGQEVKTLINKELNEGNYNINFEAENLPSGIYIYKLSAGKFSETRKMMLIR